MTAKVITFYPVVQGVGCKYTATGMAFILSQMYPKAKIALADLDFKNPYLAANLITFDQVHGIDNLISKIDGNFLTDELFKENMIHLDGLFDVLKGTDLVGRDHLITKKHVERIIEMLREHYDYVIIAVAPNADTAGTVYGLYEADEVVMVTKINQACFVNISKATDIINTYKRTSKSVKLVYNMFVQNYHIDFTQLIAKNNLKVIAGLPYDESTIDNHNIGVGLQGKITNKISVKHNEMLKRMALAILGEQGKVNNE